MVERQTLFLLHSKKFFLNIPISCLATRKRFNKNVCKLVNVASPKRFNASALGAGPVGVVSSLIRTIRCRNPCSLSTWNVLGRPLFN